MAASLVAHSITVSYGPLVVLDAVDVTLAPGHTLGVVGPNGVGKSTLLGALAGTVPVESGTVDARPRTATIGFLPQEPERSSSETVRGFLERRAGVTPARRELRESTEALGTGVG
ncbi:MAG: ATP-binding cassette domain-containing protein, partial [Ilumatobacteraceae bacterium]